MTKKLSSQDYHVRQYTEMYRSTSSIINFLKTRIVEENTSVLDIGCGGGANIYWFKRHFPNWKFFGIDVDKRVINLARKMNRDIKDVGFDVMNFLEIEKSFPPRSFDWVFAIQFISFVDFDFPIFLEKAFYLARKGIFMSSLFSEGQIEQHTMAYDFEQNWKGIYKVYSLERFKSAVNRIAGTKVDLELEKFEIDIDLPKPSKPRFGTYTIKADDGQVLQISGHMLMPWYNVMLKFKEETR